MKEMIKVKATCDFLYLGRHISGGAWVFIFPKDVAMLMEKECIGEVPEMNTLKDQDFDKEKIRRIPVGKEPEKSKKKTVISDRGSFKSKKARNFGKR